MTEIRIQPNLLTLKRRQVLAAVVAVGAAAVSFALTSLAYAKDKLFPIYIKFHQILFRKSQVLINNAKLAKAVKEDKTTTVEHLRKHYSSLTADQLSLDEKGRVVIDNADAVKKLRSFVKANQPKGEIKFRGQFLDPGCPCTNIGCS